MKYAVEAIVMVEEYRTYFVEADSEEDALHKIKSANNDGVHYEYDAYQGNIGSLDVQFVFEDCEDEEDDN